VVMGLELLSSGCGVRPPGRAHGLACGSPDFGLPGRADSLMRAWSSIPPTPASRTIPALLRNVVVQLNDVTRLLRAGG
jgi:hypothetical protein